MKYTVYNTTNGQILSQVECDSSSIKLIVDNWLGVKTVSYIEGTYSSIEYVISNGQPVKLPERPSPYYFWDFGTNAWVLNVAMLESDIAQKRDTLLSQSDWLVIRQSDSGVVMPEDWKTYRQALRDVTNQSGYPTNVIWPTAPTTT